MIPSIRSLAVWIIISEWSTENDEKDVRRVIKYFSSGWPFFGLTVRMAWPDCLTRCGSTKLRWKGWETTYRWWLCQWRKFFDQNDLGVWHQLWRFRCSYANVSPSQRYKSHNALSSLRAVSFHLMVQQITHDRRMVGHLFYDQLSLPPSILIRPYTVEKLSKDGVQRLLFGAHFLVTGLY